LSDIRLAARSHYTTSTRSLQRLHNVRVFLVGHKLPAVYFNRIPVTEGGLISHGPDLVSQFQQGASYADRILRGEKPANLPVQAPNKYELVINLKTAKALGLGIPTAVLARADEVIE